MTSLPSGAGAPAKSHHRRSRDESSDIHTNCPCTGRAHSARDRRWPHRSKYWWLLRRTRASASDQASPFIAETTNMGLGAMAESCGVPYDVLAWTAEWYFRPETLEAANAAIVNYHHQLPLTQAFGLRTLSSSDGERFAIKVSRSRPAPVAVLRPQAGHLHLLPRLRAARHRRPRRDPGQLRPARPAQHRPDHREVGRPAAGGRVRAGRARHCSPGRGPAVLVETPAERPHQRDQGVRGAAAHRLRLPVPRRRDLPAQDRPPAQQGREPARPAPQPRRRRRGCHPPSPPRAADRADVVSHTSGPPTTGMCTSTAPTPSTSTANSPNSTPTATDRSGCRRRPSPPAGSGSFATATGNAP